MCGLYPGAERRNRISRWSNSRITGIEAAPAAGMDALAGPGELRILMAVVIAKVSMLEPFSGEQCQPYGSGLVSTKLRWRVDRRKRLSHAGAGWRYITRCTAGGCAWKRTR